MFIARDDYSLGPSLKGFADWLDTKDPNENYNWQESHRCACGQYSKSIGVENWTSRLHKSHDPFWHRLNKLSRGPTGYDSDANPSDWTFGKLKERVDRELV